VYNVDESALKIF